MGNQTRGASYPSIALNDAIAKLRLAYDKVGKGPNAKDEYVVGLGYKGITGPSNRTFAALLHYGLLEKTGAKYKISLLGLSILIPRDSAAPDKEDLVKAALHPKLFEQLFDRYKGEPIPTMLANTLIRDYQVNDKSAKEAVANFRQTMDYAGLMNGETLGAAAERAEDDEEENEVTVREASPFSEPQVARQPAPVMPSPMTAEQLNRIEIFLRDGVKAGIYAPHNLTDAEKTKLKAIIDLL